MKKEYIEIDKKGKYKIFAKNDEMFKTIVIDSKNKAVGPFYRKDFHISEKELDKVFSMNKKELFIYSMSNQKYLEGARKNSLGICVINNIIINQVIQGSKKKKEKRSSKRKFSKPNRALKTIVFTVEDCTGAVISRKKLSRDITDGDFFYDIHSQGEKVKEW